MSDKPRWPPFPFFWHRTMADVLRDEKSDEIQQRKEADRVMDRDRPIPLNDPSCDPFGRR